MKCIYCGAELSTKKNDVCKKCELKLPLVKLFVEECRIFKNNIGYKPNEKEE